jgi:hypothetical protein
MQKGVILKAGILFLFITAMTVSTFAIRIKTREAFAGQDIFLGIDAKLDKVLDAQKQMQADIERIKADLEIIKSKVDK